MMANKVVNCFYRYC